MTYFKVFKSTWGLIIGFECNVSNYQNFETDLIKVNDLIFLKNNSNIVLNLDYIKLITYGILWANSKANTNIKIILEIKKIEFNAFDYQKEMFFFGIANWFCNFYNVEMPIHEINYDKGNKKYVFNLFDKELNHLLN